MILAAASQIISQVVALPTAEEQRIGVYVLAGIVGLLVSGIVSIAKEMREEKRARQ